MCTGISKAEDFIPTVPCPRQLLLNPGLAHVTHKCHNSSCEHSGQSESPYVKKWRTPTNWISLLKKKIDGESLPAQPFLLSQVSYWIMSPKDPPFALAVGMSPSHSAHHYHNMYSIPQDSRGGECCLLVPNCHVSLLNLPQPLSDILINPK